MARTPEEEARIAMQGAATELSVARTISRKARIPQRTAEQVEAGVGVALEESGLPPKEPPLPACPVPQNVTVIARAKVVGGIDVGWNPPQTGDPEYVEKAKVEYRAQGSTIWQPAEASPLTGAKLRGLPEDTSSAPKAYEARAAFVDRYGRESAWSEIKSSQPETYIPFLSADRITSGMFVGSTFTVAGMEASNNRGQMVFIGDAIARFSSGSEDRIRLSRGGVELREATFQGTTQIENVSNSITPIDEDYAAVWFFRDPGGVGEPGRPRGLNVRAEGIAGQNVNGRINLVAVGYPAAPVDSRTQYASILMRADGNQSDGGLGGTGVENLSGVSIRNALRVVGNARVDNDAHVGNNLFLYGAGLYNPGRGKIEPAWEIDRGLATLGEIQVPHPLGVVPSAVAGRWKTPSMAAWRPLVWMPEEAGENGGAGNVYIRYFSDTTVTVRNARGEVDIRLQAWK